MSASVLNFDPPKVLPYQGHALYYAGRGSSSSLSYLDPTNSRMHQLFLAQVTTTGVIFAQAVLAGPEAMQQVRIDNALLNGDGPARTGQTLLVGPLDFSTPAGPRALGAWPVQVQPAQPAQPPRPAQRREMGVITEVHDTFGRITAGTRQYFVHATQLRGGAALAKGASVSFVPASEPKGPTAYDVRPA